MSIYKEGQLVWAKLRGYNWWPAKVMESNEKKNGQIAKEVKVEFIGEGRFAEISISKLNDFQEKYSQHSVTKDQRLIEVLKTIPEASIFQFSEGHKNGSHNLTFNSILLEPKTDGSEEENDIGHYVKIPSMSQVLEPKSSKTSGSIDKDHETKSLNSKRSIEELENKQESIAAKSLMRCSYEAIPDFIQAQQLKPGSYRGPLEAMVQSPFYSINMEEFMRCGNNHEDFEESESEKEEEQEDYEVLEKKLKMEAEAAKNEKKRKINEKKVQVQRGKRAFNTRNNGYMGRSGLYTEEHTSSEDEEKKERMNHKLKHQLSKNQNRHDHNYSPSQETHIDSHKNHKTRVKHHHQNDHKSHAETHHHHRHNHKAHMNEIPQLNIKTTVLHNKENEEVVAAVFPEKKVTKKMAKESEKKVDSKELEDKLEKKELEVKNKCCGLIEGLVNKLLGMYEENKFRLNDKVLQRELLQKEQRSRVQEFAVLIEEPDDAYANNIIIEDIENDYNFKDFKAISERMKDLLDKVIFWLTKSLEGVDKVKLMNQISYVVDGAIQGSKSFFRHTKNFFITTYEFLLKNKQLTNIMDNNIITSIIDLVHELDTQYSELPSVVSVPSILTPTNRHPVELHEKEGGKCESVNHVERSTRKASGTSSESNSNIVEHMTEKEQHEEQNLESDEDEDESDSESEEEGDEIEVEEEEVQEIVVEYEEIVVSEEDLMKNMLLRRNVCQKLARMIQKLYHLKMDLVQDLVVLVEGRVHDLCSGNMDSYKKSIRILYKLAKIKVISIEEIQAIPYMEFEDFRGMFENKISKDVPVTNSEMMMSPNLNPDFSFETEVVLNIKPGYSTMVIDDDFYSNHSHENNVQDVAS